MSAQIDRFVNERLPNRKTWPVMDIPACYQDGKPLNCVYALLDQHIESGYGSRPALISNDIKWSYKELSDIVDQITAVLIHDFGIVPGNRVLIRGPNSPTVVATWLATQKCGAVAVTTMTLLKSAELSTIIELSAPSVAVCDIGYIDELTIASDSTSSLSIVTYNGINGDLESRMQRHPAGISTCPTLSNDISLIGFTSGTTGKPKATIHFHRDVLAVCETVGQKIIKPAREDVFIGTSPLAFTFGLGGLVFFPLYAGAASVLNGRYSADQLLEGIERFKATVCFTVPTFYQRMTPLIDSYDTTSLRMTVSSGEALAVSVREAWKTASSIEMTELLGSTEMLHAFIGSTDRDARTGAIGRAIPGYSAAIINADGEELPDGEIGWLAVRGPTGCRYLADSRQGDYVRFGWNITGDACSMDSDGYVYYHTRLDDMIISSGYNISGIEVENVLLEHPQIVECAVIGCPDAERGQVVTAFVVPRCKPDNPSSFIEMIQTFVKEQIASYKYPRQVVLCSELPRNESGKLQRFRLRI